MDLADLREALARERARADRSEAKAEAAERALTEKAEAVEQSLRDKIDAIGKAQSAKEAAEIRAKEAEIRAECAQGQLLQQAQQVPAMVQEIAACMLRGAGSRLRMGARGTRFNPELVAVKIEADDDSGRAIMDSRSGPAAVAFGGAEQGADGSEGAAVTDAALQELMKQYSQGDAAATTDQPTGAAQTLVGILNTTPATGGAISASAAVERDNNSELQGGTTSLQQGGTASLQGLLNAVSGRGPRALRD